MKTTKFDEEFQRLTTEMVEVAFEYVDGNKEEVDCVYIYASMENRSFFYNVFYRINNNIVEKEDVNDFLIKKVDDTRERIKSLLSIGGRTLMELGNVFIDDKREVPTLLKMTYAPKTGGFDCDIIYELQYSNKTDLSNVDLFLSWIDKEKQA